MDYISVYEIHQEKFLKDHQVELKFLQDRINVLEEAIRLHRTKVQLVQVEDMELWANLNDGEQ